MTSDPKWAPLVCYENIFLHILIIYKVPFLGVGPFTDWGDHLGCGTMMVTLFRIWKKGEEIT
jgi:hypothetical protein